MPLDPVKDKFPVRLFPYLTTEAKALCTLAHRLGIRHYLNYILNNDRSTLLSLIEHKQNQQLTNAFTRHRMN